MKVSELISLLLEQDQDLQVVVDGYESGYDDPDIPFEVIVIDIDPDDRWFNGKYENGETIKAVLIGRGNNL